MVSNPNEPLQAALDVAGRGWAVLPLYSTLAGQCTCGKPKCQSPGKHPRTGGGVSDATKDTARIAAWWGRWPESNIGIATGNASGFDALDIDPRHGGDETLTELIDHHGKLPATVQVKTGGCGTHQFFKHDPRAKNRTIGLGLDVKTSGGFVVGAGSLHASGQMYTWEGSGHPDEVQIACWPEWLLQILIGGKSKTQIGVCRKVKSIIHGERNTCLTSFAGSFRAMGLEPEEIEPALQAINLKRCGPPLDRNEVLRIAIGMGRYEVGRTGRGEVAPLGYTAAPDAILDVLRFGPTLSTQEFMVLLLHVERTIMYGKISDAISISQLTSGLYSKKCGYWIRKGCGLGRSTAVRARQSLIERGLLIAEKQIGPDGSSGSTKFAIDWENLRSYFDERRAEPPPAPVPDRTPPCP